MSTPGRFAARAPGADCLAHLAGLARTRGAPRAHRARASAVSRMLGVKNGFPFREGNNHIVRLSYDFAVCANDATVIELDDKSHEASHRGADADAAPSPSVSLSASSVPRL